MARVLTDEQVARRITGAFGALVKHVALLHAGGGDPGSHRYRPQKDGTAIVVRYEGADVYDALIETLRTSEQGRRWWGGESLENFLTTAVALVLTGTPHRDASARLLELLRTPPRRRTALVPLYGLSPQGQLDLCGVSIRYGTANDLIEGTLADPTIRPFAANNLATAFKIVAENRGTVAAADIEADTDRAIDVLEARLALALCVLVFLKSDRWVEYGLGSLRAFSPGALTVGPDGLEWQQSEGLFVHHMAFDVRRLSDVLGKPGIRELDELGKELPMAEPSPMVAGIVRSAQLIALSFTDPLADRYLRRWIAIEAILGEKKAEITESLSERLAVITSEPKDRAVTKDRFQYLYGLRSAAAHGTVAEIAEDDLRDIGIAALRVMLAAARQRSLSEPKEFFELIEKAKFTASEV